MLELREVDIFYGEVQVTQQVSIQVKEGEVVALLGSNGAGKTTTLKAISGLIRPKNGDIFLHGENLNEIKASEIITKNIAHVPEGRRLFPQMNVEENLLMGAYEKKAWGKRKDRLAYVYELFPRLAERAKQEAGTLSGGEQQMVAIGRALMSSPRLLMLDEPSLGLAPKIVEDIFELIVQLNKEKITILLVEQNANLALEVAHRAYVLETGRIVLEDQAENLKDNVYVKKAYLGL